MKTAIPTRSLMFIGLAMLLPALTHAHPEKKVQPWWGYLPESVLTAHAVQGTSGPGQF